MKKRMKERKVPERHTAKDRRRAKGENRRRTREKRRR